jgi:hypothetical protein
MKPINAPIIANLKPIIAKPIAKPNQQQPVTKYEKFPKAPPVNVLGLINGKEIYLDNYYSKDFLKHYFI